MTINYALNKQLNNIHINRYRPLANETKSAYHLSSDYCKINRKCKLRRPAIQSHDQLDELNASEYAYFSCI